MIRIFFRGGLGNQMFQYAAGYQLARIHKTELCFDTSWYHYPVKRKFLLRRFGIQAPEIKSAMSFMAVCAFKQPWQKIFKVLPVYSAPDAVFDSAFFGLGPDCMLFGWFTSKKYFKDVESDIREAFSFEHIVLPQAAMENRTRIKESNAVAVHVRRGDYLKHPELNVCTESYYKRAIEHMKSRLEKPVFFFFSDDIEWCKSVFTGKDAVDGETPAAIADPLIDLLLMSSCNHHIISNSTFAWWGAWLGKNSDQIVIAPDPWFAADISGKDIPCESWMRMPAHLPIVKSG